MGEKIMCKIMSCQVNFPTAIFVCVCVGGESSILEEFLGTATSQWAFNI